jgi:hypothetical protein
MLVQNLKSLRGFIRRPQGQERLSLGENAPGATGDDTTYLPGPKPDRNHSLFYQSPGAIERSIELSCFLFPVDLGGSAVNRFKHRPKLHWTMPSIVRNRDGFASFSFGNAND